jgi:hypothetical protein
MHLYVMRVFSFVMIAGVLVSACSPSPSPQEETASPDSSAQAKQLEAPPFPADSLRAETSSGQVLYVPVYSRIPFRDQDRTINLAATISIRNTDYADSLQLTAVDYYDSQGNLVHRYLKEPRWLMPLASTSFVVAEEDERGGVGANFIVRWKAQRVVAPPVVESVMISTQSTQGISFVSRARVLTEQPSGR